MEAGASEETNAEIQFSPPLYIQRYMLAVEYLTKHSVQNVVDFGCSECGFFRLLSTVSSLQKISLVDIDRQLLMSNSKVISPELRDYLHRRSNPLNVFMYCGSAGVFDVRMENYEAVTLIEVIEHLNPDVLQSVTENVFGSIRPCHVVVTTPNSEFNVLFGNEDPTAFRHWDHKFEWTRAEFQSWCESVCLSYGYSIEYSGVGFLPSKPESSDIGPCSQAAFFQKQKNEDVTRHAHDVIRAGDGHVYEVIVKSEFPYDDSEMSVEEKLDLEITYILRQIAHFKVQNSNSWDEGLVCVEVCQIANRKSIKDLANFQQVREYLKEKSYKLSEDGESVILDVAGLVDPGGGDGEDSDDSNRDDFVNSNNDDCGVIENSTPNANGDCVQGMSGCESDWDLTENAS